MVRHGLRAWPFAAKLLLGILCRAFATTSDSAGLEVEETSRFVSLVDWVQHGVEAYVPPEFREGLPRLAEMLELRSSPSGRAMVAKIDLFSGQLLLRLPLQRLMHAGFYKGAEEAAQGLGAPTAAATQGGLAKALRQALKGNEFLTFVATQTWLAIYLMEQARLGSVSEWAPYIEALPKHFSSVPVFFKDEDWEWLRGSSFVQRVQKHRQSLRKQFETVSEFLPSFAATYTFDEFLWARSAISTRVFGWSLPSVGEGDNDFMVPLGDMFNHRSPKQIEWRYNDTTQTLDYWMREDVRAGQELFISYGSKCNSQYLLHYGFAVPNVTDRSPSPATVRMLVDVDAQVADREERVRWLLKSKLHDENETLEPEEFELGTAWRGGGGERMLGYARLLSLPGGVEFQRIVKGRSCRAFATPPRCEQPMSMENERAALRRCLAAVDNALGAYPTSLEEDDALLQRLEAASLPFFLTQLRRDEKVVLHWWRRFWTAALEASALPTVDAIEARAEDVFGKHSPDGHYIRIVLAALAQVEWSSKTNDRDNASALEL